MTGTRLSLHVSCSSNPSHSLAFMLSYFLLKKRLGFSSLFHSLGLLATISCTASSGTTGFDQLLIYTASVTLSNSSQQTHILHTNNLRQVQFYICTIQQAVQNHVFFSCTVLHTFQSPECLFHSCFSDHISWLLQFPCGILLCQRVPIHSKDK